MSRAPRLKLLRAVRKQGHRYDPRRVVGQGLSLVLLAGVPLSGLARVDVWAGHHYLFFRPAELRPALAGVIVGIAAMYVVTFLVNLVGGRLFCGWGCPVGQLSRFGEAVDQPGLDRRAKLMAAAAGAAYSGALVLSIFAWWVDLGVFLYGSPQALAIAWGALALSVALAWSHGHFWRWEFCMSACPIGLYYSFVSPAKWFGVHFRNAAGTCLDCDACDNICPVHLNPRDLMAPTGQRPGLSLADAPGRNHCLECGDCVRACDWIIDLRGKEPVPLLMGFFEGPQRVLEANDPGEPPADADAPAESPQDARSA